MKNFNFTTMAGCLLLVTACLKEAPAAATLEIHYDEGRLTLRCSETPLEGVLERIQAVAGMEVFIDDTVSSLAINADIDSQPFGTAMEEMLEGTGANYVMVFDADDRQRVAKVYVGTGDPASIIEKANAIRTRQSQPSASGDGPSPHKAGGATDSPAPPVDDTSEMPPVEKEPYDTPDVMDGDDMSPPVDYDPNNTPAPSGPAGENPAAAGDPASPGVTPGTHPGATPNAMDPTQNPGQGAPPQPAKKPTKKKKQ